MTGNRAGMGSFWAPRRSRWVIVAVGVVAIVLAAAVTISRLPVKDGRHGGVTPPGATPTPTGQRAE